ncbi:MAG: CRISPR-associated endonuclease Cas3'' [Planctomycetes bacterium]|nr:CRISPR-associated endonuclease Cas3'' [Planctomycetota bacterium]
MPAVAPAAIAPDAAADSAHDTEALSAYPWKTIATHGGEVAALVGALAGSLAPDLRPILELAGRWHDLGKAHAAFQGSIRGAGRPDRTDLAKAPGGAWPRKSLYRYQDNSERRPGFRHELASALALFAVLARHRPRHPALLGPWVELLAALGHEIPEPATDGEPTGVECEILALDAPSFDLVAYLVASHHGKVRVGLHAAPADQDYVDGDGRGLPIRGVREGDTLPAVTLDSGATPLPLLALDLSPATLGVSPRTGASWTERVLSLLERHGPFALAYIEALLRAADIRASRLKTPDPLLPGAGTP